VCLGFYPDRGHQKFFKLGGASEAPLVLPLYLVPTLAFHLYNMCEHLAKGERYKYEIFRMHTVAENSARIANACC